MFRFAFPQARNELIERVERLQRETLLRAFEGKDTYVVYYRTDPGLIDAISPHLAY